MDESSSEMLSIDREEFNRLQSQLIELRTTNYNLKEEMAKANREVIQLQETHQNTVKDLEKANKSIQKSKKAREYQLLADENEQLLQRLHSQEDDFKLQNTTLLDEIANVCEQNEELKKKLKNSESSNGGDGVSGGHTPEIMRLRAENTALQKSLQAERERVNSSDSRPDGDDVDSSSTTMESTSEEMSSLRLSVATLEEERNLLSQQISTLSEREGAHLAEIEGMKKEIDKHSERLRKKQEIVLQLQEEKEKLISEHQKSIDQVVFDKQQIIDRLNSQLASYGQQSGKIDEAVKQNADLTNQISLITSERNELQSKYENISKSLTVVTQEKDDAKHLLNELSLELESAKQQLQEEKQRCKKLTEEVGSTRQATDDLADQLLAVREERMKADEELKSVIKLAESRKSLLDNMAIKEQETASEYKKKEEELVSGYKDKIDDLSYKLEVEVSKNKELSISLSEAADLKEKLRKFENMKTLHEEELKSMKEKYELENKKLRDEIEKCEMTYNEDTESLKQELSTKINENQQLKETLESKDEEVNEKLGKVKIVEKKSNALIKDLKRQLQQFQKREEKLQQQLLELRGPDSSALNISTSTTHDDHNHSRESSLSSFKGGPDVSAITTPNASFQMLPNEPESQIDAQDTQSLMDKIAELQQEKWLLEERVQHLENTGSALAEDVLQKSTIIQKYYMDNKADHVHSTGHLSSPSPSSSSSSQAKSLPMRLVPWSSKTQQSKDSEAMAEINRKMQRALEEALMKNIHLQKDVDMLSGRLQQQSPPTTEDTPTPSN